MVEEPYRRGVHIYMNYFSANQIQNLLQEYGFSVSYIGKEQSPNEFELGNGKLIVLSNNEKKLEYTGQKKINHILDMIVIKNLNLIVAEMRFSFANFSR